jgi:hypothetical protein
MKSILLSVVAATMLWVGGAMTSSADAQYVRYGRGYSAPRYYGGYNNYRAPRYYGGYTPYRSYYRGGYTTPYYSGYRGGYYGQPYYGGGYARPGVSIGVGGGRIGIGF